MTTINVEKHVQEQQQTQLKSRGISRGGVDELMVNCRLPAPISSSFCASQQTSLKFVDASFQNCCIRGTREWDVEDSNGNLLFKVGTGRVQLPAQQGQRPVLVTMELKSVYKMKWKVYRGQKPYTEDDLLFTVARPRGQRRGTYNICMRGNEDADFTLIFDSPNYYPSWFAISHRGHIRAVAKETIHLCEPDEAMVTVSKGMDMAFVTSVFYMAFNHAERKRQNSNTYIPM
ncbi:hypothetical protein R1flu_021472 [Riccia fluitans]|uniref:Uncharacterized protein n=1 Tax=Riccia fluitans TaxID=41844 RepID=A0ABD1ZSP4_9MARC